MMSKENFNKTQKNTAVPFSEQIEVLLSPNEKLFFTQSNISYQVAISNLGIYYTKNSWLKNKRSILFHPRNTIISVNYSTQGWISRNILLEINTMGRIEYFENKQEIVPIKIKFDESQAKQAQTLFGFCKTLSSSRS